MNMKYNQKKKRFQGELIIHNRDGVDHEINNRINISIFHSTRYCTFYIKKLFNFSELLC